jgi:hypothetical protein
MSLLVRVCDYTGAEMGTDVVAVAWDDMLCGIVVACEHPGDVKQDAQPIPPRVRALLALLNMLSVVRSASLLDDILLSVVDRPPLHSVVGNFGVRCWLDMRFDLCRRHHGFPYAGQSSSSFEIPVELQLNGHSALLARVVATEPRGVLGCVGGIVAIDALRPSNPNVRVIIRLLATQREAGLNENGRYDETRVSD